MTKVISISDEAYHKLAALKGSRDSFSKVIMRVAEKKSKPALMGFYGAWKNDPEMEKIFSKLLAERHKALPREVRL